MLVKGFYKILILIPCRMSLKVCFSFHFASVFSSVAQKKKVVYSHANLLFRVCVAFILFFGKFITQAEPIDLHKKFTFKHFSIDEENVAGPMPNTVMVFPWN